MNNWTEMMLLDLSMGECLLMLIVLLLRNASVFTTS